MWTPSHGAPAKFFSRQIRAGTLVRALEGHSFWLQHCQRTAAKTWWYILSKAQQRARSSCKPCPPHVSMRAVPLERGPWERGVWRCNQSPPQIGCAQFSTGFVPRWPLKIKAYVLFTLHVKSAAGLDQTPGEHLGSRQPLWLATAQGRSAGENWEYRLWVGLCIIWLNYQPKATFQGCICVCVNVRFLSGWVKERILLDSFWLVWKCSQTTLKRKFLMRLPYYYLLISISFQLMNLSLNTFIQVCYTAEEMSL